MNTVQRIIVAGITLYSSSMGIACGPAEAELDTTFNAIETWSGVPGAARICFDETEDLRFDGVATDSDDNIYLGGTLGEFVDGRFAAQALSATGVPLWSAVLSAFAADSFDVARDIALDSSGCVYLGGFTDLGMGFFNDRFAAAKLSNIGMLIWTSVLPPFMIGSNDNARGIALDNSGCVYLGGWADINGGFIDGRFAAAKLSNTGVLIWTSVLPAFASGSDDEAQGIALDSSGCVYLGGFTDLGMGSGNDHFAAAKLSNTGVPIWTSVLPSFDSGSDDIAQGIALDNSGCVYLGGNVDFNRFAAAKLSNTGMLVWTSIVPSFEPDGEEEGANGIVLDSSGCIYLGGFIDDDAQIGAVKLDTDGDVVWTFVAPDITENSASIARSIALDTQNRIILAGNSFDGGQTCGAVAKLLQRAVIPVPPPVNPLLALPFIPMSAA